MKSLFIAGTVALASCPIHTHADSAYELPTVGAPFLRLRKGPLFEAALKPLADVWGPAVPTGSEFKIAKSYGRWVHGDPAPLQGMKRKDYAPNGWVYNRMLLPPGDSPTRSREVQRALFLAEHHAHAAWESLKLDANKGRSLYLAFLNNLVLSENTLTAFIRLDESAEAALPGATSAPPRGFFARVLAGIFPAALAEVREPAKTGERRPLKLGFSGANLNFLQVESEAKRRDRAKKQAERESKILRAPTLEPAGNFDKAYALGRYIAEKNLDLPGLSHEEVDAHLYMRAVAERALRACPDEIQDKWKNRHFTLYRAKNVFGRPSGENLWFQFELPGALFFHSDQALRSAQNEAELAFVLVRPLVMSLRYGELDWNFGEPWSAGLAKLAANSISRIRLHQSVKHHDGLDVSDEIAADFLASSCIANAGYLHDAGLTWLTRMRAAQTKDWATWFSDSTVGLDYRLEQLTAAIPKGVAHGQLKPGTTTNPARFRAAMKLWNL